MGITVNDQIRSDLVASTPKNQQEKVQAFSLLQQQQYVPSKNQGTHFSGNKSCPDSSCAVKVGEKRKRNECGETCNTEHRSKSPDVIVNLSKYGSRRVSSDNGDAGEEPGSGKQLHEVDLWGKETLPNAMNRNGQLNRIQPGADVGISHDLEADKNSGSCDTSSEVAVQPEISECADPKFNDFDKVREEANFAVGQTWALYDTADGMPRLYAQIRKVSAPCFGLRITYLEPDPDDEKEIQWFEEDLPVSAGKFRFGKNQNTKERPKLSHLIQCNNEGSKTGHFTVSPRKGETWALFKNWDIKWSSEPDSHRKYEYEFVEVLSDYTDRAGVFVAYLHKAKGFAGVFFRTGTGDADRFLVFPRSLYRFSHRVPSFKLTGIEGKGVPKDAYELDRAALPETIEEIMVPTNYESHRKPKRHAIYFASKGKVLQTGQIWSFYSCNDELPLYYGRIQKITFTQALKQDPVSKLHISLLKALPSPDDVIQWVDKQMPITCGTYYARKALEIITPDDLSRQIVPQTSMDGIEYIILPKIGDVWAIYRHWSHHIDVDDLEEGCHYDVVEVLDDALGYKVLLLEPDPFFSEGVDTFFRAVKEYKDNPVDGSEPIFTIRKSKLFRFSHQVPASRVTKEKHGDLEELYKVDYRAIPSNVLIEDHCC